jgi:hypothetical protein
VRGVGGRARLAEYAFLLGSGCLGAGYALLHDLCTYALCPAYFVVGKGVSSAALGFWPDVAWLAARAGWSAGLVVGCVLLFSNNPHPRRGQLSYDRLAPALTWPVVVSIPIAVVCGCSGPWLLGSFVDARFLTQVGVVDPQRFLATWGVHIGSYVGATAGLLIAAHRVRMARPRNLTPGPAVP